MVVLALVAGTAGLTVAGPADRAGKGPLKVFILAGQSNMQGAGLIKLNPERNEGKGSLEYMVKDPGMAGRTRHMLDADGHWVVRKDVWIWYFDRKGGLRNRQEITWTFGCPIAPHLWPLLIRQILTVAHYTSGLAQSARPNLRHT